MRSSLLLKIVCSISATSIMLHWQFIFFGIRFQISRVLMLIFIIVFLVTYTTKSSKLFINPEIKTFILFQWGWFLVLLISGIVVIFTAPNSQAFIQYFKGVADFLLKVIFFSFLGILFTMISRVHRVKILDVFLITAILSCFYQFASIILLKFYNFDMDKVIWPFLSGYTISNDYEFTERYIWSYLYRLGGLSGGPNLHAALLLCVMPFLLLNSKVRQHYSLIFVIVLVSFTLTMSRSGFFSLMITFLCFAFMEFHFVLNKIKLPILFIVLLAVITVSALWDHIVYFISLRPLMDIDYNRMNMFMFVLDRALCNPLGFGYNTFSVYFYEGIGIKTSSHNSWLLFLFEEGFLGFFYQIWFSFYILYKCISKAGVYSKGLFYAYIGVSINSLMHTTLTTFPIVFLITILFFMMVLNNDTRYRSVFEKPT